MTEQTSIAQEFLSEADPIALAKRYCISGFLSPKEGLCAFLFADSSLIYGRWEPDTATTVQLSATICPPENYEEVLSLIIEGAVRCTIESAAIQPEASDTTLSPEASAT